MVKAGKIRRKTFRLKGEVESLLEEMQENFGIAPEKAIEMALLGQAAGKGEGKNAGKMKEELLNLQREMFEIEREWSPLKYEVHTLAHEIKPLAISLMGLLNENRTLRRILVMEEKYGDARILAEKYIFMRLFDFEKS